MDEMIRPEGGAGKIGALNILAAEARMYSEAMAMNMIQLGRVLTEAKKLVRHGEWTQWVGENAHMGESTAQSMMRAYRRFGEMKGIEGLEKSKIFKMLSLPAGTEQAFVEEHDISGMTAREVEQAVRKVREEANAQLEEEHAKRIAAETRADELARKPQEDMDELTGQLKAKEEEIAEYRSECARMQEINRTVVQEKNALLHENASLSRDLKETEDMLHEQQEEYDRLQGELLNAQSMAAQGDAERTVDDRLTAAEFSRAVGQFIGLASRIPHMGRAFAAMGYDEREDYVTALEVVEEWAAGARRALSIVDMGGVVIHAE